MNFTDAMTQMNACSGAKEWIADNGLGFKQAWETCQRPDWMLWLVGQMCGRKRWPDRKAIVLLACDMAETVLHLVPEGEDRPWLAIEAARNWCAGTAAIEEVRRAADAAYAAADAAAAAYAAYAAAAATNAAAAAYRK